MRVLRVMLAVLATGCTSTGGLRYAPAVPPISNGVPTISAVTVTDARGEADPTYVGAIRGGFGNPLKTIKTDRPVAVDLQAAFEDALRARNLLGSQGPDTLEIRITKLLATQIARREAEIQLYVTLRGRGGQTIYGDVTNTDKINGSLITFDAGILASADDLRAITQEAVTAAVDQTLDKPGFVAALAKPGS